MFAEAVLIEFQHTKVWNLSTDSTKEGYSVPTRWSMTQPIKRIKTCSEMALIVHFVQSIVQIRVRMDIL